MGRRIIAALLGVMLWTCAWGLPASAGTSPIPPPTAEKKLPLLSSILRYSTGASRDLLGVPVDPAFAEREMKRLADRLRPELADATDGERIVGIFRRVLLEEERFTYDKSSADPGNYLLESVLARRKGNCLGLSLLYLALADRLGVPFSGVYVPSHCFVRYEGSGVRVNVEFADGGASWEDARYRQEFRIQAARPYLRSLSTAEVLGVFLKTVGAGYSRKGREEDALRLYDEAGRLYPGLPDVYYNAGVSLQKLGRNEEAIASYHRALALDPEMAAARDNLSILLAGKGRYEEAIAEARRAVELEPWNAATRGNLAAVYCGCGRIDEGIREYRAAVEADPGNRKMKSRLERAYITRGSRREGPP